MPISEVFSTIANAEPGMGQYRHARVLVTGASGFIGRSVCQRLVRAGAEVWVTGHSRERLAALIGNLGQGAAPVLTDLSKPGALAATYREVRPDVTFNLAGYGVAPTEREAGLSERINARVPGELALLAAEYDHGEWSGQTMVHVGSGFEYGSVAGTIDENTSANPSSQYARTKLMGTEQVQRVREQGARVITARVFTVYGPGEHTHRLLPSLLRTVQSNGCMELTAGEQERDFTFVGDVADGLLRLAATANVPPIVNLATGRLTTVRSFAETVINVAGGESRHVRFGALPYRPDEVWQGSVSVALLNRVLGWIPSIDVRSGVVATCKSVALEREVSA
jgi:nucleoside-diphosphate-sugar epimerase